MVELALGREPCAATPWRLLAIAALWFVRRSADGVVRRVPSDEEIARVEHEVEGPTVEITVRPGDRLSALHDQDSYSFAIATIAVGADSEEELITEVRAGHSRRCRSSS